MHFVSKQSELYVLYFKSCDMNDATVLAGSCSALEASAVGQYADEARRCPRERLQNTSGTVLTCAGWTWCSQITNLNWRLMQHENKAPTVSLPTAQWRLVRFPFGSAWPNSKRKDHCPDSEMNLTFALNVGCISCRTVIEHLTCDDLLLFNSFSYTFVKVILKRQLSTCTC